MRPLVDKTWDSQSSWLQPPFRRLLFVCTALDARCGQDCPPHAGMAFWPRRFLTVAVLYRAVEATEPRASAIGPALLPPRAATYDDRSALLLNSVCPAMEP
jgi:hypothetical protein